MGLKMFGGVLEWMKIYMHIDGLVREVCASARRRTCRRSQLQRPFNPKPYRVPTDSRGLCVDSCHFSRTPNTCACLCGKKRKKQQVSISRGLNHHARMKGVRSSRGDGDTGDEHAACKCDATQ